jgi:CarD family transcriptional regulator
MTFQVGEKVVYPNHGVGTIENISTRAFGSSQEHFYLLRLTYNSMTVMIPFSHVADVGLRKVTRSGEIARVLTFLAAGSVKFSADWKLRYKVNSEKMRSGALPEIAEVFKALTIIQADKPLSFREKKMLDCARRMLLSEVSICRAINEVDAIDLLRKALAKADLPMPEAL